MKLSFYADDPSSTTADLTALAVSAATVAAAAAGQPVYPGTGLVYPGYTPAYGPPGTVAAGGAATLPIVPMALGGIGGYLWKKSALAGIVGVIAGYILGNMFGSVAVQGQVTGTPLMPSNQPYPGMPYPGGYRVQ